MSRALGWFTATLREWGWRHTAIGLLVGSLALFNMGGALFFPSGFAWTRSWVYNVFEFGLPYVFAVRVADRAVADGVPRLVAYGAAVLGVIVTGVYVIGPLMLPLIGGDPDWGSLDDFRLACGLALPFSIATVAYAHWRRAQDTLARVQAAEVARAREEQLVQAARLLALQARVEPQFLFDALQRVRARIDQSAAAAEGLLGQLIALLRAMQPAAGATASTVAREFELVAAYAGASESPSLQSPRLLMEALDDAARARFAPLVLLPALRRLVGDAPEARWQVGAMRVDERLRLVIAPSTDLPTANAALLSFDPKLLHDRLIAVHGADARLALQGMPTPALYIDVPYAAAHDPRPDR
ncbi:MAG TPA: histidine kinase [Burkholderiaceae bacterium]|nr:histidine kinase [Burkholderiaceae bacterium]